MTKKVKSHTREQFPEAYRLAVILIICVIKVMAEFSLIIGLVAL